MSSAITFQVQDSYPFQAKNIQKDRRNTIQVRQKVSLNSQPRPVIRQKIRLLKNMGFQYLVGLQSTNEDGHTLELIFQWIPQNLSSLIGEMSIQELARIRAELVEIVRNLASNGVEHEFKPRNIALNWRKQVRYFLGWDFVINPKAKKQALEESYLKLVERVLKGDFRRGSQEISVVKNEYTETMDTLRKQRISQPQIKSQNVEDAQNGNTEQFRCTTNAGVKRGIEEELERVMRTEGQEKDWKEEKVTQVKPIRMGQLDNRISKIKELMRTVTGKNIGKNLTHIRMHIDQKDLNHRIYEQDRLMITPSFTQIEKKIAQFKERRLCRAYNNKNILFSHNNCGYQLKSRCSIQNRDPSLPGKQNHLPISLKANQGVHNPSVATPKGVNQTFPINKPVGSINREIKITSCLHKRSSEQEFEGRSRQNTCQSQSPEEAQSPTSISDEYRHMAKNSKYCMEFISLLQQDEQPLTLSTPATTVSMPQIPGESKEQSKLYPDRVQAVIRNSLKLIRGMKCRQPMQ